MILLKLLMRKCPIGIYTFENNHEAFAETVRQEKVYQAWRSED